MCRGGVWNLLNLFRSGLTRLHPSLARPLALVLVEEDKSARLNPQSTFAACADDILVSMLGPLTCACTRARKVLLYVSIPTYFLSKERSIVCICISTYLPHPPFILQRGEAQSTVHMDREHMCSLTHLKPKKEVVTAFVLTTQKLKLVYINSVFRS